MSTAPVRAPSRYMTYRGEDNGVRRGPARLAEHLDGGWALPGGGRILDREEAESYVAKLEQAMCARPWRIA